MTRLSKLLTALLTAGFAVQYFLPSVTQVLALVPGKTLPCVWQLVSAGLLITNPIELVVDCVALLVLAKLVEPIHGSKEFLKFIFIVNLLVSCTVFAAVYVMYAAAPVARGTLLYTQFSGFHGIVAALLVAVKQVMPHHEVKVLGASTRLSVKFLPSLLLLVVCVTAFALGRVSLLAFYLPGTYLSWVYLRFFQPQPDSSSALGDASDDFKFSSFFPDLLATPVDWVAGLLGSVTRLRHAQGSEGRGGGHHLAGMPSALGSDSADANRRRERGAKALEERLMKTAGAQGAADVEHGGKGVVSAAAEVVG